MTIYIAHNANTASVFVAQKIAAQVQKKPDSVLGLATGNTQIPVYKHLVDYARQGLDFSKVVAVNLDEFYPMQPDIPHSFARFMDRHLFDHVKFAAHYIPDGRPGTLAEIAARCDDYETLIRRLGRIDLQLLGIGRNGHDGFNEPGTPFTSRTRLADLSQMTRQDAAKEFGGIHNVPEQALTMGLATIFEARQIVQLITGLHKAPIVRDIFTLPASTALPATAKRGHKNCDYVLDEAAAALLPFSVPVVSLSKLPLGRSPVAFFAGLGL